MTTDELLHQYAADEARGIFEDTDALASFEVGLLDIHPLTAAELDKLVAERDRRRKD
jgi:hypothetical protein